METSKKVKELLMTKGEGLVNTQKVNDMNTKIKALEKKGLVKRQNYTLPQIDTVGSDINQHKTKNKNTSSTKDEYYFM